MTDIFDLDTLLAQLVVALGAAMVVGNGAAIVMHRRRKQPRKAQGEYRPARAWFLVTVGLVIGIWGAASLLA